MQNWTQRLRSLIQSPVIATIRLLPRVGLGATLALAGLSVVGGIITILVVIANSVLIASVPRAVEGGLGSDAAGTLWVALLALGAAFIASQSMGPVRETLGHSLGSRLDLLLRKKAMKAISRPSGIAHLEDLRSRTRSP